MKMKKLIILFLLQFFILLELSSIAMQDDDETHITHSISKKIELSPQERCAVGAGCCLMGCCCCIVGSSSPGIPTLIGGLFYVLGTSIGGGIMVDLLMNKIASWDEMREITIKND